MARAAVLIGDVERRPRSTATLLILLTTLSVALCGFTALGVWQLYRLQWKLDLIERVESRIHAAPVLLPAVSEWSQVNAIRDEYKRVRLEGHFIADRDTRVQALTELGGGFWVLTPFQLSDGGIVLVNRGFVPSSFKSALSFPSATSITGLLRVSEPRGGFLRSNAPADDRWYSRDVAAIAAARGLASVAPFFVDAEQVDNTLEWPRGGLTVTRFSNNHLGYAITWFALALLVAWAMWRLVVSERRLRTGRETPP
jgi:surfeit locus 1 family protein